MERPTCPDCQRHHGPGILCETYAAWDDNIFRPAVATKSGAAIAAAGDALDAMTWKNSSAARPFTYEDLVRGAKAMERGGRRKT